MLNLDPMLENISFEQYLVNFRRKSLENDNILLVIDNDSYKIQMLTLDLEDFHRIDNKYLEMYSNRYTNHPNMEILLHLEKYSKVNSFPYKLLNKHRNKSPIGNKSKF